MYVPNSEVSQKNRKMIPRAQFWSAGCKPSKDTPRLRKSLLEFAASSSANVRSNNIGTRCWIGSASSLPDEYMHLYWLPGTVVMYELNNLHERNNSLSKYLLVLLRSPSGFLVRFVSVKVEVCDFVSGSHSSD